VHEYRISVDNPNDALGERPLVADSGSHDRRLTGSLISMPTLATATA
jgi:hypothetical protein